MKISFKKWNRRHARLKSEGLKDAWYSGSLSCRYKQGDLGLDRLAFDDSPAALRLWNFVLSENERLEAHRKQKKKIIGALKDMGTVPVIVYCFSDMVAFYPDGTWWTPCFMKNSDGLLRAAEKAGFGESYCPVRAMLGAFITRDQFPIPDALVCSTGAVCDDLSAIAQYLSANGHDIYWWDVPYRRELREGESFVSGLSGEKIPEEMVAYVRKGLSGVVAYLETKSDDSLTAQMLQGGISRANRIRGRIREILSAIWCADVCVMPALETMMIEVLAIHYCSDMDETEVVLDDIADTVKHRVKQGVNVLKGNPVRIFWVNPVADLSVLNLIEDCGGRVCGSDYMFRHAVEFIDETLDPLTALAIAALSDPMVGSVRSRAELICDVIMSRAIEALVIARIPGASHCAAESEAISRIVKERYGIPVVTVEVSPMTDSIRETLVTRFRALVETAEGRRK